MAATRVDVPSAITQASFILPGAAGLARRGLREPSSALGTALLLSQLMMHPLTER
jgi:hypothetical protein